MEFVPLYILNHFIELFGYKKVGFTRCNETVGTEAPIGDTLLQIRKSCDDLPWCTMIYQPNCNTRIPELDETTTTASGTTEASDSMYMCRIDAPTLYEDNWFSCLWEKGKFKI